jgi:hypothetical protein
MTFGRWQPLAEAEAHGAGVLQARLAQGLHQYPRGKSAMVYYDADEDLGRALGRLRAIGAGRDQVWTRTAACADPTGELLRLVDRFTRQFGAPPAWNPTGT